MAQRFSVKEGQRYSQRLSMHSRVAIWKVGSIVTSGATIPHARLINVADPLQTKTVSCFILGDRMYFELVAETATGVG
jgi:hypothetical protein